MKLTAEIAVTLAGVGLLSWMLGVDGAILGGLCWYAINAVAVRNAGASALAYGLLLSSAYAKFVACQAHSLPPPDNEIPFSAAPVCLTLLVFGAALGTCLAHRKQARSRRREVQPKRHD